MTILLSTPGVQMAAGGGSPVANCCNLTAFHSSPSQTNALIRVLRAGQMQVRNGGAWSTICNFVDSGLPDAAIGDLYEVRVIQSSGGTLDINAGLNTWLAISTTRSWGISDSPGQFQSFSGTIEVREIADTANTSGTCTVTLNTEDGS